MAVSAEGEPLPWYTYPFICFLEPRVPPSARVFEFGFGNSTLWWSKRVHHVDVCEHDAAWMARLSPALPGNVKLIERPMKSDGYIQAAINTGASYDIIVIDGRRRVRSAQNSIAALGNTGVVIWDNTERDYYEAGFASLYAAGLTHRLDFWGMGPISTTEWCTSVFYRPTQNCLNI
jgi:hypothetical protein